MAIDTSMFGVGIPAGTYTKGQTLSLSNVRGPAIVRDGYGPAKLKRIFGINSNSSAGVRGHVVIKNSNWVDSIANLISPANNTVGLSETSSNIQKGHDAPLTPNSGWDVSFVFDDAATTTVATDIVVLIDVDYPAVQAVQNPREATGLPVTIMREDAVTINAYGSVGSATWTTYNVDFLKAGSKYLLVEMGTYIANAMLGFISISGAAGQNGLERIIPSLPSTLGTLRYFLDYSTPLVKGPMNINYLPIGTAGTANALTEIDWVKRA